MSISDVALPLLDHLTLREGLRLSVTNHTLRTIVYVTLMAWIARCKCRCAWMRGVRLESYAPIPRLQFVTFAEATVMKRGSYLYHPRIPDTASVMHQLNNNLCRECLSPCKTFARASTGRLVIVCKSCSLNRACYSAMCGREEARDILRNRVANIDKVLRSQRLARRAGNRAHLYWVHALCHLTQQPQYDLFIRLTR